MTTLPATPSARIAYAVGITTSAFLSGSILAISSYDVAVLSLSPRAVLQAQIAELFSKGSHRAPQLAVLGGSALAYVAWESYRAGVGGSGWQMYAAAAACTMGIGPFTGYMVSTNMALKHKASQDSSATDEEVGELLQKFKTLNTIRGLMPLAGAAIGLWVLLGY